MRKGGPRRPGAAVAVATLSLVAATLSPAAAAPDNSAPPVLSGLPIAAARMPTAAGISHALAGPISDPGLGASPHVAVVDVATGRLLFDRLGQAPAIPASTLKLLTAAAALTVLGPTTRLRTQAYVAGPDVYVVGGGDPTLSAGLSAGLPAGPVGGYPSFADLSGLARTVARSHRIIRRVIAVSPQYGGPEVAPGWSPSYLTEGEVAPVRSLVVDEDKLTPGLGPTARGSDPVLDAAQKFQSALTSAGAKAGPASVGVLPTGARVVGAVSSPPVSALVEQMLNFSDDDIAEGLGRQIALRRGLPATFAGTATALEQVAQELGLSPAPRIADASGLSRSDAIAPAALTTLLRKAAIGDQPRLRDLLAALPVAGFTGTLAVRFRGAAAPAAGMVRAKTGWLNEAAGLAGVVTTADGRLLAFAALVPAPDRGSGEAALDRLAATIASCGCR